MNDTSFVIQPGKENKNVKINQYDIGDFLSLDKKDHLFKIVGEHGYVNILFYRDDIIRIIMNPNEEPNLYQSFALIEKPSGVDIQYENREERIIIRSKKTTVHILKKPLRISFFDTQERLILEESNQGMAFNNNKGVFCYKVINKKDHFYGFGEKTGFLDKRGDKMTMWNTDVYAPHNPETDALYQSIPFFMTLREGNAHGIFLDNSFKTIFDMKSNESFYSFKAEGGQLDYYLMSGPSPKEVIEQYTWLTGRMPIPPKWALGYHQSRYSYKTEEEVRAIANHFIKRNIPVDAIYLDIHYMDEFRVFTFDKERFPSPDKMILELKEIGIHLVPIVDPGVKEDPEYLTFKEGMLKDYFCKYMDGQVYYGDVWPGKSAFPDFINSKVRKWWGEKHRFYTEKGIVGIWNDMNEPAVFNETKTMDVKVMHDKDGELKTHREMHNVYGLMMGESTYQGMKSLLGGNRPFLLTRSGYSGIQRYAAVWTGDNRSFWDHLAMSIPMCLNLGFSGIPFVGADVGGFAHDSNGELLTRWTQLGAFYPFFRNHSSIDTIKQEPWSFGEKYEKIIKKYIQLRYQWLPHLYSLFHVASKTGLPIMRPLILEFPEDENTSQLYDQFMVGDNIIIAPILQPGISYRVVYLPKGQWFDYWTDEMYQGEQHVMIRADLDKLPIFIKAGSFITLGEIKQSTQNEDTEIYVHLYPIKEGDYTFTIYDDDGKTFDYNKGLYIEKEIEVNFKENIINILIGDKHKGYNPTWNKLIFYCHSYDYRRIIINDKEVIKGEIISQGTVADKNSQLWRFSF